MNDRTLEELRKELVARGFSAGGVSPNDTIVLDDALLAEIAIASLLETMVARREKVFRSGDVVGMEAAKKGFDDAVLAIEATKAVIGKLSLP